MVRLPRLLLSRSFYHIITRSNNRIAIFKKPYDYQYYLELLQKYKAQHPFDLYHYCLMPNHVHLLIQTKSAQDFAVFMKKLNLAYSHYYKKQYGWIGHIWQNRYRSQPIGKDEYFIQCGKYIELNPLRAKLVNQPEDYQYSSYRYYARGQPQKLLTTDLFYEDLGTTKTEQQKNYRKMLIDDIVMESYRRTIWGSNSQRYNEQRKIDRQVRKSPHPK